MTALLQQIQSPEDVRRLPRHQLKPLADELRAYLLESVSKTGGHLSSNLGTVELTLALHYAVPYTHLPLPPNRDVYLSVVAELFT